MQVTRLVRATGLAAAALLLLAAPAPAHEEGCVEDGALHRPEVEAPLPHAA